MAMDYDIFLAPFTDSWKIVKRAEALGYRRAWFYDTQLLNAEPFVSMAAAAVQTSTIRLATGVLIPSNRIAPVTASALASLNALAPGRIDFGISTGFTARRTLGLGPVKLGGHGRVRPRRAWPPRPRDPRVDLRGTDAGRSGSSTRRSAPSTCDDPIPPARRGAWARGRAGSPPSSARASAARDGQHRPRRRGASPACRPPGARPAALPRDLHATAAIGGCVLHEGEPADSPRAQGPGGADGHRRAPQPGRARGLRRPRPPLAARIPPIARALSPDLSRLRAGRRALSLRITAATSMFLRPEEHEDAWPSRSAPALSRDRGDELRERFRALESGRVEPSRHHVPPRASRDAGGVGGAPQRRVIAWHNTSPR